MNTEQLCDTLRAIAEPIDKIGMDEEFNKKLMEAAERGSMTKMESDVSMVSMAIPLLFGRHREETFKILSVLTGKSAEQIAAQPGIQTVKEARECLKDKELLAFFRVILRSGRRKGLLVYVWGVRSGRAVRWIKELPARIRINITAFFERW